MVTEKVGGIDLNSSALDLTTTNEGEFKFPIPTPAMIETFQGVNGFVPTIINVTPIPNLPFVLGLTHDTESSPYAQDENRWLDQAALPKFTHKIILS